jgi:hypothetical protein
VRPCHRKDKLGVIARLGVKAGLTIVASVPTAPGARNAVATEDSAVCPTDSREGKILAVPPAATRQAALL